MSAVHHWITLGILVAALIGTVLWIVTEDDGGL